MKLTTCLSLLLSILVGVSAFAEPKLEFEDTKHSFGWIPFGSVGVQYSIFRSVGTDTLIIHDIVQSCDCVKMPLSRQKIAPGDSLVVPIIWQFGSDANKESNFCRVLTNMPQELTNKAPSIRFEGIVIINPDSLVPVSVKPFRIELSRLAAISIDSISFTLRNRSIRDLDLTLVAFPYEECEVFIPDSIMANSTETGYIKLRADQLTREFISSMTIRMNGDPKYERSITIPVRRKIFSN